MSGYLNAPSPFTGEGWYMTSDAVEVDGEYVGILGRKSELIFVVGEKVSPAGIPASRRRVPPSLGPRRARSTKAGAHIIGV